MNSFNWRKAIAPLLISVLIFVTGCQPQDTSPYAATQKESTERAAQPAVAKDATQGSEFNKFFPKPVAGYERVFVQEKKGFAQAKLNQNKKEIAKLSVSDTKNLPEPTDAAKKFETSTEKIAGYPAVDVGANQTSILVANRYQVTIRQSPGATLTKADRANWLSKFDLTGLSKLK
ncbi:MAG TPA: hypothetical protein V6D18_15580 [Thermosynechococcaceae cyanobacterium]